MTIVHRVKDNGVYKFVDSKNKPITDKEILEYIGKLVIPPNYKDVKIFYTKLGQPKILYQGHDSKNRLQRIYSPEWTKKAARRKFCELLNFAEQIQSITSKVKEQMLVEPHTKQKMIAMIMRMVMVCYFRIGNKRYQELYGSFGAMNIRPHHVKFHIDKDGKELMHVSFSGKKGILNSCNISDTLLIKEMKKLLRVRDDDEMIFQWNDSGLKVPVRAIDINAWLKNFDNTITSKDFRTYDANIFLIIFLRAQKDPKLTATSHRKKIIIAAMKVISEKIHNTPAILKKNYTAGGIIDLYINEPLKFSRYFLKDDTPRQALITYLRDYCKDYVHVKKEIIKGGGRGLKV